MTNIKKSILWRVTICLVAVGLFAVWVAVKMFTIQLVQGEMWLSKSDSTVIGRQAISPTRGNIYADDGALLATSMPNYEVRFDPTVVNPDSFRLQVADLASAMNKMFPEYSASYYKRLLVQGRNAGSRYILIKRRVNYNQFKEMKEWPIFRMGRYKGGMIAQLTTRRVRPAGQLAYRTIGYWTKDNPGVGLEREYNVDLSGVEGSRLVQKISGGYRPLNAENLVEPQNGRDVHTTLNVDFQEIAHNALSKALIKHKADHGCVLIMEVKTGKIKAIVNLKNLGEEKVSESYNYAIGESFEPGSIFKVFSAMAALEDGLLTPEDSIDLMGGVRTYFGKKMKDSDHGKDRYASFKTSFAKSSNVAFSSIIYDNYKKDPAAYIGHLKRLELHKKTGIRILGEAEPFLNQPASNSWSRLTLPWLAIGYENLHTPLQMLTAYNGVINNGLLVKPYLVDRVTDAGLVLSAHEVEEPVRVCSEQTSATIRDFTAETVLAGTGRNIRSSIVSMAGKTGTAQIANASSYQAQRQYNASFIGHFPAEEPVYSVLVVVNKPSNGVFYASWVAAPVFKELAEKIYTISVKQDVELDSLRRSPIQAGFVSDFQQLHQQIGMGDLGDATSPFVYVDGNSGQTHDVLEASGTMPNLMGLGARDAMYLLEQEGVLVKVNGYGKVKKQSPEAGAKLNKGSTVYIQLSL